ncbi:MAG: SpoIVB peptidase, partial [Oscillospiraceae bacterium]|nr:SpoIVB peptidase [Oscillospiraceae bacterium]
VFALLMAAVFVFESILPDRFFVNSGDDVSFSSYKNFITISTDFEKAKTVFSSNENPDSASAKLMGIFPIKEVSVTVTDEKIVTVCGSPFGVKMFTDGVLVVGFSRIETESGICCPAVDAGLLEGDVLKSINGAEVFTNEDVASIIESCGGKTLSLLVERDKKSIIVCVTPEMMADGSGYKAGFWVRDSTAGIGTLTFYDPETMAFAGLGHAVCDIDTGEIIPFSSGEIVTAAITSVKKGAAGAPGELGGTFTSSENLGVVKTNNETGLYGVLEYEIEGYSAPIAHKQEVYEGEAVILSTVSGTEVKEYDIVIEKISLSDGSMTKNMVIRVTDEELLEVTGGIVQGMSGSPIIQNGKLVGAVTHVFVNDPTKGYGIFIENMLEAAG